MKIIGITGGVGAGKSTVLNFLKEMCDCEIAMADDVAKALMQKGGILTDTAYELFGENAYCEDGTINAKWVADIIFSQPEIKTKWETAVHPAVKNEILNRISKAKDDDKEYFFIESALLIEDNYQEICHEIWYVFADENTRRLRLRDARQYSDEKVSSIFAAQMKDSEYRKYSACVIDTGISLECTRKQIENKLEEYRTL